MNYTICFEEGCLTYFTKAFKNYEEISQELGGKFHDEFWNIVDEIKRNSLHYQIRYKNIRIAHLNDFPYGIHFLIENKIIFVTKILHYKQYY